MRTTLAHELAALETKDAPPHIHDHDPQVRVGGVMYALVYGEGSNWDVEYGGWVPVYVWVAVHDPTYVAPVHVARTCDELYQLGAEVRQAERAAGWPSP